jgi:hypothetical protein
MNDHPDPLDRPQTRPSYIALADALREQAAILRGHADDYTLRRRLGWNFGLVAVMASLFALLQSANLGIRGAVMMLDSILALQSLLSEELMWIRLMPVDRPVDLFVLLLSFVALILTIGLLRWMITMRRAAASSVHIFRPLFEALENTVSHTTWLVEHANIGPDERVLLLSRIGEAVSALEYADWAARQQTWFERLFRIQRPPWTARQYRSRHNRL